jgi:hypothetical protein
MTVIAVLEIEEYSRAMTMFAHAGWGVGHLRGWTPVPEK